MTLPETATHTNYNTGEPCECDATFGYALGPCLDQPEPTTGSSPENGTG